MRNPLSALFLIITAHALILKSLIFHPYPELFIYPYLTNNGLLPYRQIFDQHFPGVMFFPVNLGSLGMDTPEEARLLLISIVAATHLLLFLIGKKVFRSSKKALLANLIFLLWQPLFEGWVLWIDSFMPLFLLPAFYFSYLAAEKGERRDFFLAGLFLGAALLFKQVVIPLVALIGFVFLVRRKNLKELVWFSLGVLPLPLFMVFYFWAKGVFSDFWYWTFTFNLTTFAQYGRKLPTLSGLARVGAVFGLVLFSLPKRNNLVFWNSLFLLGSLVFAFARFDFIHLQPALPFVALGSVIAFDWIREKRLHLVTVVYLLGSAILLSVFYRGHLGDRVLFFDQETLEVAREIREQTKPGEHIFIFGAIPHIYQMSNTLPSGEIFVFQFPWFMRVSQEAVFEGLVEDPPSLVVADRTVVVSGQRITEYASEIDSYLLENYETVDRIGNTEFLLRRNSD